VDRVEDAVPRQRGDRQPERAPEPGHRHRQKHAGDGGLDQECTGGIGHHGEEDVVRRDDRCDRGIECPVAIEAHAGAQDGADG
jgi:hypothetical protein